MLTVALIRLTRVSQVSLNRGYLYTLAIRGCVVLMSFWNKHWLVVVGNQACYVSFVVTPFREKKGKGWIRIFFSEHKPKKSIPLLEVSLQAVLYAYCSLTDGSKVERVPWSSSDARLSSTLLILLTATRVAVRRDGETGRVPGLQHPPSTTLLIPHRSCPSRSHRFNPTTGSISNGIGGWWRFFLFFYLICFLSLVYLFIYLFISITSLYPRPSRRSQVTRDCQHIYLYVINPNCVFFCTSRENETANHAKDRIDVTQSVIKREARVSQWASTHRMQGGGRRF